MHPSEYERRSVFRLLQTKEQIKALKLQKAKAAAEANAAAKEAAEKERKHEVRALPIRLKRLVQKIGAPLSDLACAYYPYRNHRRGSTRSPQW